MNKKEFIKRTAGVLDASAFVSTAAAATAINPNVWDTQLRDFEEKALIVTPLAEQFDFRNAGVDYTVTVDVRPTAAALLTETTDVAISAFSTRKVTFTPKEYGAAYQVTRKEAVRAFFNVAERMVRKLGYAMAEKKDALAYAALKTGATNTIFANGVAAASSLQTTDTIDFSDLLTAINKIEESFYKADTCLISYKMKQQFLDTSQIQKANEWGTRAAIEQGLLGEVFGLKIYVTPQITATSNVSYAIVMGPSQTGEKALGYAIKRDPIIEREYHALGRYWDIVGHEEYDFQVLHPDAVVALGCYT